ncbi:alpha/beta fold hydrolase [uncultured Brevibacterium sp.]|uniref:alpha/beta fold hydrolase n=1 Tax=uncultured Brevibacterium sp. TaxID=189678 RepID=UPI0025DAFAAE|nr:alpha/beta fold hydrolase [uncultured Brevibacterium sp.]
MLTRTYTIPGLNVDEHTVTVPLDHFGDTPGELEVFARVYSLPGSAEKPYLVYLQGGPGFEAQRVTDPSGWVGRALREYNVVMLDQRGTGQSSPVGFVDGHFVGTGDNQTPATVADYLTHFRADAIVEDAEVVRESLGASTWAVLGQSFGGFTALRYLAEHPESLERVMFTGGLPRVPGADGGEADADPAVAYQDTWTIMAGKSERFFQRYPHAREAYERLFERATDGIELPDGTVATQAHVRALGQFLGASGGAERLNYLLALGDSVAGRHDLQDALTFGARNPIYAVLHESCWASGVATRWAAERARPEGQSPFALAGEHVTQDHFETGPLEAWKDVAHLLADHEWPVMWDADKLAQARGKVPAAAAVYFEDAYVPCKHSLATAKLAGVEPWVTNEYEHNGLRASGERVLDRLLAMTRGEV